MWEGKKPASAKRGHDDAYAAYVDSRVGPWGTTTPEAR